MSTLLYTATTGDSRIPLGRRIGEILHERGESYSIRKLAERIGMNRETLRIMIAGGRPILPSQLEVITKELGIDIDRVKQTDTFKMERELVAILQAKNFTKVMLMHAYSLATKLADIAIGSTERAFSLNNLGKVYFAQQDYSKAHEAWLQALEYTELIHNLYGDNEMLLKVSSNLMLTYSVRKEYSNVEKILSVVEEKLSDNPEAIGIAYYTRMKLSEDRGEIVQAKKYAYLSLEQFELSSEEQAGKGLINAAHYEYLTRDYQKSADLLKLAIPKFALDEFYKVFAAKEYVKSLIRLRDYDGVIQIVENFRTISPQYPDLHAKLQIMYSMAKDDPAFAQVICNDKAVNSAVRVLACKYLMSYYSIQDDAASVLKYYKMGRMCSSTNELFDEGEI